MSRPGTRAVRILGWGLLLSSLLGWSAWWVICNVYEFAPALASMALACAWLTLLPAVALRRARPGLAWCLAVINALYLLAVHRQLDHGAGAPLYTGVLVLVTGLWWVARHRRQGLKQQQPA